MKNVIKWTLYILALIATALCFIFPIQAKEVCDNVMNVLNTPFAIAGVSITLGGVLSFVVSKFIISNTKFGRKELDGIKEKNEVYIKHIDNFRDDVTKQIDEYKQKYEELKVNCDNKITVVYSEFEDLKNKMVNALRTIPNKKVQAIIDDYEKEFEERKDEIITKTINTNDYIDEKLNEIMQRVEKILNEERENNKTEEE